MNNKDLPRALHSLSETHKANARNGAQLRNILKKATAQEPNEPSCRHSKHCSGVCYALQCDDYEPQEPQKVVCPEPKKCPDNTCPHRIEHEFIPTSCNSGGNCGQICIPVSQPSTSELLLTDEEIRESTGHIYQFEPPDNQICYSMNSVRKVAKAQLSHCQQAIRQEERKQIGGWLSAKSFCCKEHCCYEYDRACEQLISGKAPQERE